MHIFSAPSREAAEALLSACSLPTQDLTDSHFQHFFGCGAEDSPAGVIGLEVLGRAGLLRSLAVLETARGMGCGKRLIQEVEAYAAMQGINDLYLLTTTAKSLFESVGYSEIERDSAPAVLRSTTEFSSLCPASATIMHKCVVY